MTSPLSASNAAPGPPTPPEPEGTAARLRLQARLLDCVPESVIASDLDGRILYWSPGAERMFGYRADEVLGQPCQDFAGVIEPADEAAFRRDLMAQGHWEGEHIQKNRAGQTFWTATRLTVFPDEQGRPAGFVGIYRHVNESRQRELRLATINECCRNLGVDFAANVARFVALAGELLDGTSAHYIRLENGLPRSVGPWHRPGTPPPRDQPAGQICCDLLRQHPSGVQVIRNHQHTAYAHTDPNGTADGMQTFIGRVVQCGDETVGSLCVGFQRDFEPTDDDRRLLEIIAAAICGEESRQRAVEALGARERQLRAFLDATSDLVFLKDDEFRYVISNRANNEFLGKSEADIQGRTDFDLMPREIAEGCRTSDEETLRRGTSVISKETAAGRSYQTLKFPVDLPGGRRGVGSYVRDVTSLNEAEEILRLSEEKFAKAFQTSPYASLITRAEDGHILDVNDAFIALFGHARQDLLADSTLGIGLWANLEDRAEVVAAQRRGDVIANREFRFRTKDGHEIIGLFSTQMIPLAGEDCLLSSINDITERQRATERLRESEFRLATALDIARAGYWEYDAVTDVFTFNDAFYRVYKTTAAQAGGYQMPSAEYARRFCHPDDADIVAREIAAAMACAEKGFSRQFEHRILCGDGTTGYITVRFFVVKDADGRTIKTYGVNQNVTERKLAEEKLRENLERFQDIAANIPGAIYQFRIDPADTIQVPFMTAGCEDLFERSVAGRDFTGLLFDHMHPADRARFQQSLAAAARTAEHWQQEFRIVVPDGRTKWLRAAANPRQLANGTLLWNGVLLDITGLKEAEEARRASEERFRLLVKNSSDVIAVIDAAGALQYISAAEEPITGFRPQDLLGKNIHEIIHPGDWERIAQAFQTAVAQPDRTHRIECRHVHKTRGWVPVEIVGQSFLAEPAVKGIIVSVRDITERTQTAEEQTRQLDELRRWYTATLGRENRVAELKREINALARRLGEPPPYSSVEDTAP